MNLILFPTDWSETSLNAFLYAHKYAEAKGLKINLLHVYQSNNQENQVSSTEHLKSEAYVLACKKRDEFLNLVSKKINHPNETIERVDIISGDSKEEIIKATEPMYIEVVIMSTDGAKEIQNGLKGSITRNTIQKAHCPVLAVPPDISVFPPQKILCAIDFKNDERNVIRSVMSFADIFRASVTFIYIKSEKESEANELLFSEHYKTTLFYLSNLEGWSIDIVKGEDVIQKLKDYIKKNNFDVLVFETNAHLKRSDANYKSMTKQMSLETKIPLLTLHSTQ